MEINGLELCGLDENHLNMKQEWLKQCCLPGGYGHTAASASAAASNFAKCYGWMRSLALLSGLGVYFRTRWISTPGISVDSGNAGTIES